MLVLSNCDVLSNTAPGGHVRAPQVCAGAPSAGSSTCSVSNRGSQAHLRAGGGTGRGREAGGTVKGMETALWGLQTWAVAWRCRSDPGPPPACPPAPCQRARSVLQAAPSCRRCTAVSPPRAVPARGSVFSKPLLKDRKPRARH